MSSSATGTQSGVSRLSPDGRLLATASVDRTARLWDVGTGELVAEFGGHPEQLRLLAIAPKGGCLVTEFADRDARIWNIATGRTYRLRTGHEDSVRGIAFSYDGELLATACDDGNVGIRELATDRVRIVRTEHTGRLRAISFSPDGTRSRPRPPTGRPGPGCAHRPYPDRFSGHLGALHGVAYSPDGSRLATASADHTARIWDVRTGRNWLFSTVIATRSETSRFRLMGSGLPRLRGPDRSRVGRRTWGRCMATLAGHTEAVYRVDSPPDGQLLGTASADRTARIWDVATGRFGPS